MISQLLLIRHGKAEEPSSLKYPDDDRPLSQAGRIELELITPRIAQKFKIDAVWCSPLLRTQETAQFFAAAFGCPLETFDGLALGAAVRAVHTRLAQSKLKAVALVGHEPGLCRLLQDFIGAAADEITFVRAGVAAIAIESLNPPKGRLLSFTAPDGWGGDR